ncbi:MAG: hypothetical protein CSB21_02125 [Deltaproteobacteria bacterium]|nr:MAG: hypothetical protein CSB21_02125 [Deltaproteobacteria bacterium]
MKKFLLLSGFISLLFLSVSSTASAAPFDWGYDLQYGFSTFQGNNTPEGQIAGSIPNTSYNDFSTRLQWGIPSTSGSNPNGLQSALQVYDYSFTGTTPVNTNVDATTITHENFVQQIGTDYLTTATLSSQMILTPNPPAGSPLPTFTRTFDIKFIETDNNGPHPADIFYIENYESFSQYIGEYDGYKYTLEFIVPAFNPLTILEKELVGLVEGTPEWDNARGFVTPEDQNTDIATYFKITATSATPEPGTMILFGLGLLGLAGFSRKRKK